MFRDGADPENILLEDVLCNFCRRPWGGSEPFIEGHQGSHACGRCLAAAYRVLVLEKDGSLAEADCVMCLEHRQEPCWRSPAHDDQVICRRCLKQGAGALHKDPDTDWRKPE